MWQWFDSKEKPVSLVRVMCLQTLASAKSRSKKLPPPLNFLLPPPLPTHFHPFSLPFPSLFVPLSLPFLPASFHPSLLPFPPFQPHSSPPSFPIFSLLLPSTPPHPTPTPLLPYSHTHPEAGILLGWVGQKRVSPGCPPPPPDCPHHHPPGGSRREEGTHPNRPHTHGILHLYPSGGHLAGSGGTAQSVRSLSVRGEGDEDRGKTEFLGFSLEGGEGVWEQCFCKWVNATKCQMK